MTYGNEAPKTNAAGQPDTEPREPDTEHCPKCNTRMKMHPLGEWYKNGVSKITGVYKCDNCGHSKLFNPYQK